jgi:hypothetical protein
MPGLVADKEQSPIRRDKKSVDAIIEEEGSEEEVK